MTITATQQMSQQPEGKQLRADLRTLLQTTKQKKHELASAGGKEIEAILEQAEKHLDQITKPREEAYDAEIFSMIAEGGVEMAKKLAQGDKQFTPADFVARLKTRYVDDPDAQRTGADDPSAFEWASLARTRLSGWFAPAPVCFHMLGPMDAAPKARRVLAQRKRREPLGEAVRPADVAEDRADEKQETDRNMEEMWEVLSNQPGETTPLLELVVNHNSFAQTVENMFALSFLVKENRVELKKNEEDGIMVHKRGHVSRSERAKNDETQRVQFIVTLDMEEWEQWKQVTDEKDCLMKHRAPVTDAALEAEEAAARRRRQREEEEDGEAPPDGQGPSRRARR